MIEKFPYRFLMFGDEESPCNEQSCVNLVNKDFHVFDYSLLFMESLQFVENLSRVLVFGMGGAVIINSILKKYPQVQVDVIEIEPKIVETAKKFFFFNPNNRVKVYIGDGYIVAQKLKDKYDAILIDAYEKDYIPFHLMCVEFNEIVYNLLSDNGILATNVCDVHASYAGHMNSIIEVFGDKLYFKNGQRNIYTTMVCTSKGHVDFDGFEKVLVPNIRLYSLYNIKNKGSDNAY